jgi:hypothetical protein
MDFEQALQLLTVIGFTIAVLVLGGVAWLMTNALMKTAELSANRGVMIALSLLTLVAIGAAAAANGNSAMVALAGTGMGALAGAVTSVYGTDKKGPETRPDDTPKVPGDEES